MNFKNDSKKREWIERRLFDLREGACCENDLNELRVLLQSDSEARRMYLQANQLDHLIELSGESVADEPVAHRSRWYAWVAAAAVVAISCSVFWLKPEPIAVVESTHLAVVNGVKVEFGTAFRQGTINLMKGSLHLKFRNGAETVLDGKTELELVDDKTVHMRHGRFWVYCPPSAAGFTVVTPRGEVIDHGTKFGIVVDSEQKVSVHLFEGRVDVVAPSSQPQTLSEAGALEWSMEERKSLHSGFGQSQTVCYPRYD